MFNRILDNKSYKFARKVIIAIIGLSVLLVGAAMIVLPGPAIIVIPAGLAILATEFAWARRLLRRLSKKIGWETSRLAASTTGRWHVVRPLLAALRRLRQRILA